jgi:hypothetical protein
MKRDSRNAKIKELRAAGYMRVATYPHLYINESGHVYNFQKMNFEKIRGRNMIQHGNTYLSIPKLVLQVFDKQPYRDKQRISYIDGNNDNNHISNIKYTRIYERTQSVSVNQTALMMAIRCYFEVKPKFTTKDKALTINYLQQIANKRLFFAYHYNIFGINIFRSYLQETYSQSKTAKLYSINIRDCEYITNSFTNMLIQEIIKDMEPGILHIKKFKAKPLTKTQSIKKYNKMAVEMGINPIPLRQTAKQKSATYLKQLSEYETKRIERKTR